MEKEFGNYCIYVYKKLNIEYIDEVEYHHVKES